MKTLITLLVSGLFSLGLSAQTRSEEERLNEEFCTGLFKTTYGSILDVAANPSAQSYLNILEWLNGRVAGLQVYKNRTGASVPLLRGGVPCIFVDEIQVSLNYLNALSSNDIAIIKVIKTPFYGGFNCGHGAIAIYTLGEVDLPDDSK